MDLLVISSCKLQIALKPIEINMDKPHMKFSAFNVDFDGPSLDF